MLYIYIYVHIYIYIYTYTYMYVHVCTCVYRLLNKCIHIHRFIRTHTYTHICMHMYIGMFMPLVDPGKLEILLPLTRFLHHFACAIHHVHKLPQISPLTPPGLILIRRIISKLGCPAKVFAPLHRSRGKLSPQDQTAHQC